MNFADIKANTPRLVVLHRSVKGKDEFQWGVSPGLPVGKLIGAIVRAQVVMVGGIGEGHDCTDAAFAVALNDAGDIEWWANPAVSLDSLVGLLETIKVGLIASNQAQQAVAQRTPDTGAGRQTI